MNNQNNNITLMSDIDPSLYTNLKPKQQAFIHCLDESISSMTTTEFSRKDLKQIANDHGIAWAPAWIVKDKTRVVKRGTYSVPELAAYRNSKNAPKAKTGFASGLGSRAAEKITVSEIAGECCEDVVGEKVEVPQVKTA